MEDVLLDYEERKKKIDLLKGIKFEDFETHPHYFNKFGRPRHGVTVEQVKNIYYQFDKI